MNMKNHVRMGRLICEKMRDNDMPLNRRMFLFGSIAPDLFLSYLYRPHRRAFSFENLERHLHLMFFGGLDPSSMEFSFHLGIMAHYVCDFLCFAHTPAFTGGFSEHIAYEKSQTVSDEDARHFDKHKSSNISLTELSRALNGYFARCEQLLSRDGASAIYNIPIAVHIAAWAASAAYLHAAEASEKLNALPIESVS